MKTILLAVTVEAKDEYPDGRPGREPGYREAASRIQDVLSDVTKHDETIGWRVTQVKLAK